MLDDPRRMKRKSRPACQAQLASQLPEPAISDGLRSNQISSEGQDVANPDSGSSTALLQIWMSPSFPVGAFAYSHGLEKAVELGWVRDRATLTAWLRDLVEHGSLRNDLILLTAAWNAATRSDDEAMRKAVELSVALQASAERHLEATQPGGSFLIQIDQAWPCDAIGRLRALIGTMTGLPLDQPGGTQAIATSQRAASIPKSDQQQVGYPVAVGCAAAGHAIALAPTLMAYALAFTGNLVSAAIRLSVIGQSDGQRTIAALLPALDTAAQRAATSTLDDLGSACIRSDLAALAHETQHTRLFRS